MAFRNYTYEEDLRIYAQARGEVSLHKLMRELKSSREGIERRAHELGVVLSIRRWNMRSQKDMTRDELERRRPAVKDTPLPEHAYDGTDPYRIVKDILLERLMKYHGDRRYEELKVRR